MNNTITIKMLAKELNLSVATVSKALRDSYEISIETKQKVLALAQKLNYVPNLYASSLRKRISKTIAVVLPEVADSFFSQAINGIESIAKDKGYHVLVYLTHEVFAREETILKEFQSGRVDGILISVSSETTQSDHIKKVIASGIPVVFFDRICVEVETAYVVTNDFECGYNAANHLIQQGCKKIAFLSISDNLTMINLRQKGYVQALADAGLPVDKAMMITCSYKETDCNKAIKKMISTKKPDGIIGSVEKLATAVYTICNEMNLRIPADIKVMAFSNLPIAAILNPPLTTITQPAFEMGKAAAILLFKALEKSKFNLKEEKIVLPSVLIQRGSTANTTNP
jgi:LacI family transcriptional regulator